VAASIFSYPRLDYTALDFFALRTRVLKEIRSIHTEWSEEAVANFGNILLELPCAVGDTLAYYQDNQAHESRLTTARRLVNARAHAKVLGYKPRGQTAAKVYQTFTLAAPALGDVVVPRYTPVSTKEITAPIVYQTQAELTIAAGQTSAQVLAEHSQVHGLAVMSTGLPNMTVVLPQAPFLDGSLSVTAANGAYVEVDNFVDAGPLDRVYVRDLDAVDRAVVRFPAGDAGQVPSGLIEFTYKTGGGRAGRVDAGKLTQLSGVWRDAFNSTVLLSTTNVEKSTPAEDREGVASIQVKAPQVVRVQQRAVAREDFEISAEQVPGVVRALYVTRNEIPGIEENRGILYVVPSGLGEASQALLDEVAARFASGGATPSHVTHRVDVRGAVYLVVVGLARVTLARAAKSTATGVAAVGAAARAAWETFFAPEIQLDTGEWVQNPAIDFGYYFQRSDGVPTGTLAWSDAFNVVRDVAQVTKVDAGNAGFTLNGVRDDLAISPVKFPISGGLTLVDAESGASF
jgi:hypothetical protein